MGEENLNAASESANFYNSVCPAVNGSSLLVFEIRPRDGQRTDDGRTDVSKQRVSGP